MSRAANVGRPARALGAEAAGTFAIVAAACLADGLGGSRGGIAAANGATVALAIAAFAGASGAHFNPAVTLALACARRFPWPRVPAYLAVQLPAALAAVALVQLAGVDVAAAVKSGAGPAPRTAIAEAATTVLLVGVILLAVVRRWPRPLAVLAIGGAVALGVGLGWPVGAGGMNPARALAPAVLAGAWTDLPLFVAVPLAAGLGTGLATRAFIRGAPAAEATTA